MTPVDVEVTLSRAGVRSTEEVVAVVLEDVKVHTLELLLLCCVVEVTGGSCVCSVLPLVRGVCSVSDAGLISGTMCSRGLIVFRPGCCCCELGSDVAAIDIAVSLIDLGKTLQVRVICEG